MTQAFTEAERALLRRVADAVQSTEPEAQILLYGSRARGDAEPDSDWDILILLDGHVSRDRVQAVRHRIYEVEVQSNAMLSVIVRGKEQWASSQYGAMPFRRNVTRDGVTL